MAKGEKVAGPMGQSVTVRDPPAVEIQAGTNWPANRKIINQIKKKV